MSSLFVVRNVTVENTAAIFFYFIFVKYIFVVFCSILFILPSSGVENDIRESRIFLILYLCIPLPWSCSDTAGRRGENSKRKEIKRKNFV